MTYVYVVYKIVDDGTAIFAGAWQDHDKAKEWCGRRDDVKIARVAFIPADS